MAQLEIYEKITGQAIHLHNAEILAAPHTRGPVVIIDGRTHIARARFTEEEAQIIIKALAKAIP